MKYRKPWIERFLVYITFLLLASCASSPKYSFFPNEYSKRYLPLGTEDLRKVEEIKSWKILEESVSLIRYNPLSNQLIAVNEQNKKVVVLNIETGETNTHSILDVPDFRILGADTNGEKLLGAMSRKVLSNGAGSPEYLQWIAIWNADTGRQTDCLSYSCAETNKDESTRIGASIDYDGKIVVEFTEYTFSTWGLVSDDLQVLYR